MKLFLVSRRFTKICKLVIISFVHLAYSKTGMQCFVFKITAAPPQPMAPPSQAGGSRRMGSITDYDPMTGQGHAASPYSARTQSTTAYNSQEPAQGIHHLTSYIILALFPNGIRG